MSVNKYKPHVLVVPEDRADEQIANGFMLHDKVDARRVQVVPCAGGWASVLEKFRTQYIAYLQSFPTGHVILLIDFDGDYTSRRQVFDNEVPSELKSRTFVIGAKFAPEDLRQAVGIGLEKIGLALADDCFQGTDAVWKHDHLEHNEPDRLRLVQSVRPIVFAV